ncbi:glycosyltransferase family 4 protein [Puniceicoccaceae bacterium K14]|nr:glycosyltransferase family 4 protein [Puniceicoccaceae bacterium K14]
MSRTLYISTGHTAHSQFNTGIQRVTRSIAREAVVINPHAELLEWNIERGRYIILDDNARKKLAKYNGPKFHSIEDEFGNLFFTAEEEANEEKSGKRVSLDQLDEICDYLASDASVKILESAIRLRRQRAAPLALDWVGWLPLPRSVRRFVRFNIRYLRDQSYRRADRKKLKRFEKGLVRLRKAIWKDSERMLNFLGEWRENSASLKATAETHTRKLLFALDEGQLLAERIQRTSEFESKGRLYKYAPSMAFRYFDSVRNQKNDTFYERSLEARLGGVSPQAFIENDAAVKEYEKIVASFDRFVHLPLEWVSWLPIPRTLRRSLRKAIRKSVDWRIRKEDSQYISTFVNKLLAARSELDELKAGASKAYGGLRDSLRGLSRHLGKSIHMLHTHIEYEGFSSDKVEEMVEGVGDSVGVAADSFGRIQGRLEPLMNRLSPLKFKARKEAWVVIPELMKQDEMEGAINDIHAQGAKVAVVFHDSIPLLYPEWVNEGIRVNHEGYMMEMTRADCILAVSEFSANCFRDFVKERNIEAPRIEVCANGVAFAEAKKEFVSFEENLIGEDCIRILHIGTLEPRKNHRIMLEAWHLFKEQNPQANAKLTLIGNPYDGFDDLRDWVSDFVSKEDSVEWLGGVDDATVKRLYEECHFTVFPSIVEGFGLPVLESIWHEKPCLTANFGAMEEVARDGGCLTVDTKDAHALADGYAQLILDADMRARLVDECKKRPLRTWKEYAEDMHRILGVDLDS